MGYRGEHLWRKMVVGEQCSRCKKSAVYEDRYEGTGQFRVYPTPDLKSVLYHDGQIVHLCPECNLELTPLIFEKVNEIIIKSIKEAV